MSPVNEQPLTLLETYEQRNPRPWWRRKAPATALELAAAALEDCRCSQLHHAQHAEYHSAMQRMLAAREQRLTAEVRRLSTLHDGEPS